MTVASNKQIVRRFLDAAMRGDEALMRQLLHADVEVHEAASLPWSGVHRGVAGFQRLAGTVYRAFLDSRVDIDGMIGEGDRVVVMATLRGRSRRNGQAFSMPIMELWELADGRITRITPYYFDTAAIPPLVL